MKLRTADKLALAMLLFAVGLWVSSYFVRVTAGIDGRSFHGLVMHEAGGLYVFISSSELLGSHVRVQRRTEANGALDFVGRIGQASHEWDRDSIAPGIQLHRYRWRTGDTLVATNVPYPYVMAAMAVVWAALWHFRRRRERRSMRPLALVQGCV